MATIQATKIVAPNLWGWLGDRSGRPVYLVRIGAFGGGLCFLGVLLEPGFWGLLVVMLAFTFFWNAVLPLYEVITLSRLGEDRHRYGQIRLWGSVGFIVAVGALGALLDLVPLSLFPWLLLPIFAGLIASGWMVEAGKPVADSQHHARGFWPALWCGPVLAFLVMSFLLQVSHGAYYTFLSIHLEQHGYDKTAIGLLWSLGVLAEIAVFLGMHRFLGRFSIRHIALVALGLTLLRWLLIAEATDSLVVLIFAQTLHAASYAAMHAISVQFLHQTFKPQHHGQAQALYSGLTFGAGGALGAWISGYLVTDFSTSMAFLGSAMAIVIALLVAALGFRRV